MKLKAILTLYMVLISVGEISACDCIPYRYDHLVNKSDEIFIGKVIKSEDRTIHQILDQDQHPVFTSYFQVSKKWKGSDSAVVKIVQPISSCMIEFDVSESEYLIFTYRDNIFADYDDVYGIEPVVELTTDICISFYIDTHQVPETNIPDEIEKSFTLIEYYLTSLEKEFPDPVLYHDE